MIEDNKEINSIVKGIEEKKGQNIRVIDLRGIEERICDYLVICDGGSPTQVAAIADSVEDIARKECDLKPQFVDGLHNALWVVMDYHDIIVHVFVPEMREFYGLEEIWG